MGFDENWELLSKKHPELAQKVLEAPPSLWNFSKTGKNGELNLEKDGLFIHSNQSIEIETRQWSSMFDLSEVDWLLVYGIGLGYYYQEIQTWLKANLRHHLIFLEDDLGILKKWLELDLAKDLLNDSQVDIYFIDWNDPFQKTLEIVARKITYQHHLFVSLISYEKQKAQQAARCQFLLKFKLFRLEMMVGEYLERGSAFFNNFYKNLFEYPFSLEGNSLYGKFKDIPAIICGAGPSLQKNIEILKNLKDRALIFAGGTAMNALNAYGFIPHFGMGVDPFSTHFTRLIMNIAFETPFFYRNRMNFNAVQMIHGNKLYLAGASGYTLPNWFDDQLGLKHPPLDEGCNVINMSLSVAKELGCNPIICIGLDLAYSSGQSYSPGIEMHAIHDPKEHFITKSSQEDLVLQNDIYGQPVFTLWKWIQEAAWFSNFASTHPDLTLINSTEGGIGFASVPNVPLHEISEVSLKKQYDFDTLLHAEMLSIAMPESVNLKNIQEKLSEFAKSLKASAKILREIYDYDPTIWKLKIVDLAKDPTLREFEERLKSELAYQELLKVFDENFTKYVKDSLEDQQNPSTLLEKLSGRYQYLMEITVENLKFIEATLERQAKLYFRRKETSHEKTWSAKVEDFSYKVENGFFEIEDPELKISLKECLPKIKKEQFFSHERFKLEQYFLENLLHGPSILYNQEGKILAKTYFLNGKKIGRSQTFFENGNLHSEKRYDEGLLNGKQHYYYSDGTLKTLLNYDHGLLDGKVQLYFPNGQLKRELDFKMGLRVGFDRLYNEFNMLEIEAEYKDGRPIGTAKMWHSNGNLAKEIVYSTDGIVQSVQNWNFNGELIDDRKNPLDYFDQIASETERLQEALDLLISKLDETLIELTREKKISNDMFLELHSLKTQLEEFKKLGNKLQIDSGLKGGGEPIWKSPSSKRLMKQYLELMSGAMQETLIKIRSEFNQIQKNLNK